MDPLATPADIARRSYCAAGTWGVAFVLWSNVAFARSATEPVCASDHIKLVGPFDSTWAAELERACASLEALPDRDPRATLELVADGAGVRVTVRLGDGRSAQRTASAPGELAALIEALVTLPPPAVSVAPAAEQPEPEAAPVRNDPVQSDRAAAPQAAPPGRAIPVSIDLAALATTRILGGPTTLGLGVVLSANLDIDDGWLVGLRGRADPALFALEHDAELTGGTFGGGLELGRRIQVPNALSIDIGVGVDGLAEVPYPASRERGPAPPDDVEGDVRTRLFGKVWVPGKGLSFMGLLGLELSPLRVARDDGPNGGKPAFGGELGAGIAWGGL